MEKIKKAFAKTFKGNSPNLISSVILIALGLILIIMPNIASALVFVSVGIMLVAVGVINIVRYFTMEQRQQIISYALAIGIISCAGGILIMILRPLLLAALPFLCGGIVVIGGVLQLQKALQFKKMNVRAWFVDLVFACVLLILGTIILLNPFKTAMVLIRLIGAALLIEGVLSIISGVKYEKKKNAFFVEFEEDK